MDKHSCTDTEGHGLSPSLALEAVGITVAGHFFWFFFGQSV